MAETSVESLKNMYDDERRDVKLPKPQTWEEMVEEEWDREDKKLFTMETYKEYLASKAPKLEKAPVRQANDGKDVMQGMVALPKKHDVPKENSSGSKTKTNQLKKKLTLQEIGRQMAAEEEKKRIAELEKEREQVQQRINDAQLKITAKKVEPRFVQLPQCHNWPEVEEAVASNDYPLFQQLTSKVAVIGYEPAEYDNYGRIIKKSRSWNDTACVVRCALKAIDNEDDVFLGRIINYCESVLYFSSSWRRNPTQDTPSLFEYAVDHYLKNRSGDNVIEFLVVRIFWENQSTVSKLILAAIDFEDENMIRIANIPTRGQSTLLKMCGNTVLTDKVGFIWSPLHYTCSKGESRGNIKLLEKLCEPQFEYDVDDQTYTRGYSEETRTHETCLHIAAKNGYFKIVKYLCEEKKANVTIADVDGKIPTEVAKTEDIRKYLKTKEEEHHKLHTRWNSYTNSFETVEFKTKAILRLLKDYKELLKDPFPNIQAAPLENDIFKWHVILSPPSRPSKAENDMYPFAGLKLHLVMTFPENYPRSPPMVKPSTYIKHPNVFGAIDKSQWICLDMLQDSHVYYDYEEEKWVKESQGWTSAYSVPSILMQLQAFLFDENVPQYGGTRANEVRSMDRIRTFQAAAAFQCEECGYNITYKGYDLDEAEASRLRSKLVIDKNDVWNEDADVPVGIPGDYPAEEKKQTPKKKKKNNNNKKKKERKADAPTPVENLADKLKEPEDETRVGVRMKGVSGIAKQLANHSAAVTQVLLSLKKSFKPVELPPYKGPAILPNLPDVLLVEILDYLQRIEDLSAALRTCKRIRDVGRKYTIWIRRELLCFYNKKTFHEDILGIGLYVERHKGQDKLKTLSSPLDLISRSAFLEDELRESAWQEKVHYWLPIPIHERHSKQAMPLVKSILVAIVKNISFEPKTRIGEKEKKKGPNVIELMEFEKRMDTLRTHFEPLMVLEVLPRLMNHMVVALMKEDTNSGIIPLHASEKALLGYCTYHHILLNLVNEFPEIQHKVDHMLEEFIKHDSRRVKKVTPDLGELLVHLSIASKVTWEQIAPYFLQEFFDRTVMWTLDYRHGNHGELAFLESEPVSQYRLDVSLETTRTSCRLLMFQVFFLRFVGRPKGSSLQSILAQYNNSYGHPQPGVPERLQRETKKIHNVKTWEDFYVRIGLPTPSPAQVTTMLRDSVRRSEQKGYHVCRMSQADLFEMRVKLDFNLKSFGETLNPSLKNATQAPKKEDILAQLTNASPVVHSIKKGGKPIRVNVRNLSYRVKSDDLKREFQQFASNIIKAVVPEDENGKTRGFGFIIFNDEKTVNTVLEFMQGAEIDRRAIRLERVIEDPDKKGNSWSKVRSDHPRPTQTQFRKPVVETKKSIEVKDHIKKSSSVPSKKDSNNPFNFLTEED